MGKATGVHIITPHLGITQEMVPVHILDQWEDFGGQVLVVTVTGNGHMVQEMELASIDGIMDIGINQLTDMDMGKEETSTWRQGHLITVTDIIIP